VITFWCNALASSNRVLCEAYHRIVRPNKSELGSTDSAERRAHVETRGPFANSSERERSDGDHGVDAVAEILPNDQCVIKCMISVLLIER
jgi:hypothetical protein